MKLRQKLVEIRKLCGYVQKQGTNSGQGYTYATAADVLEKVRTACDLHGVATYGSTRVETVAWGSKDPKEPTRILLECELAFTDAETGEELRCSAIGEGTDFGDKASYKAQTGAMKYILQRMFLISWGDDPEADASVDKYMAQPSEDENVVSRMVKSLESCGTPEKLAGLLADLNSMPSKHKLGKRDMTRLEMAYSAAKDRVAASVK